MLTMMAHRETNTMRSDLLAERNVLAMRLEQVDQLLAAFELLESQGMEFGRNGAVALPKSPIRREIRNIVLSLADLRSFSLRQVLDVMKKSASRMSVRSALDDLVSEGLLVVVSKGRRGKPTMYKVADVEFDPRGEDGTTSA